MRSFIVYFHAAYNDDGETEEVGGHWRVVAATLEDAVKLFRGRTEQEIYRIEVESKVLVA